jgi:hypothetical protein
MHQQNQNAAALFIRQTKNNIMGNLLYTIAVILVIIWAISFFGGFYTGGIIHTLIVIAIIAVVLGVIRRAD